VLSSEDSFGVERAEEGDGKVARNVSAAAIAPNLRRVVVLPMRTLRFGGKPD